MWYLKKLVRKALAILKRFFRFLLCLFFQFDKWHLTTLYEKKYAEDITQYLNSKPNANNNTVIEIGCGLGDIIRNLNYLRKTGFDIDVNVLKAAHFLSQISFKKADFKWFKFPESNLDEKTDVIILVNWIHHVEPSILKSKLEEYFKLNLNAGGCIILDTVQDKEYRFNHNINYLANDLNTTVTKLGDYERQRQVWAINK
jgi:SAM-dependent methyltransferase